MIQQYMGQSLFPSDLNNNTYTYNLVNLNLHFSPFVSLNVYDITYPAVTEPTIIGKLQ